MPAALTAGVAYFAIVFTAGFALGAGRVLVLLPHLGEAVAIALELPVMLGISWFVCRWLIRRHSVPGRTVARAMMGASAFILLMGAEALVSVAAFGRSLGEHFAQYRSLTASLGLTAQLAFAAFPLLSAEQARQRA
jgi:hypothetical protein